MAGIRDTRADRVFGAVNMGLLTVLVLLVLYPLIYVVSCSVSDPSAVGAGEVILLPKGFTLMGYRRVFQEDAILTGYGNTLLYTVVGTAINLAVTVPAGYALSRRELPFHRTIMMFFLFTMYFSGGLVPTFLLVSSLGLYNTRAVLVILGPSAPTTASSAARFSPHCPRNWTRPPSSTGARRCGCFSRSRCRFRRRSWA